MARSIITAPALAGCLLVSSLALTGCGSDDTKTDDASKPSSNSSSSAAEGSGEVKLIKDGTLTVCTSLPYDPFEVSKDGKIVGFDVDLIAEIGKKVSATPEYIDTPFEGINTGTDLKTDKCDIAAAAMTITDTRKKVMDFTNPYFDATQALLVKKDSTIAKIEDLKGKRLGVQTGTTGEEYAKKNAGEAQLVSFEDVAALEAAVKTGQVDAGINDNGPLNAYVKQNNDVKIATEFDTGEKYGFAVKQGNAALLKAANDTLADLKSGGDYQKIYDKWFKADA